MLSIIISSYQIKYYTALEKNIEETIGGISYEIIRMYNPGKMAICKAYNMGATKAKYKNLLFIHEDILLQTNNWGELLINHLEEQNTGVLGLAGSNYVPIAPSSWSVINTYYTFGNVNKHVNQTMGNDQPRTSKNKAFAVDGVFLAVKKTVFKKFLFDESLKGFHGYDTDFSLRIATKFNNYVLGDIFIKHFSKGNLDKTWLENHIQIRKKNNYRYNQVYDVDLEIQMFYAFLKKFFYYNNFSFKNIIKTFDFLPRNTNFKNKFHILNEYIYYLVNNKHQKH